MNYIVVDLEWNQAMSSKSSVFNKLPIHLRGEIIEIGAVKLNDDMSLGEEFTIDVKPVYFKRMHYKVKKLTGFDKERLAKGLSFPDAMESFRAWCGDDVTFLTWGCDDRGIMEQNIIIHDLDWDWIAGWVNLQLIYNLQTGGDKNQKSLASAMEHFQIEQTRVAHDALGDAYNTALVCTHLNMEEGLKLYPDAAQILASRMPKSETQTETQDADYLLHESYSAFATKAAAFADERIVSLSCPVCGKEPEAPALSLDHGCACCRSCRSSVSTRARSMGRVSLRPGSQRVMRHSSQIIRAWPARISARAAWMQPMWAISSALEKAVRKESSSASS